MSIRYYIPVTPTDAAQRVAAELIRSNIGFRCEPHPKEQWLFDVKLEQDQTLERITRERGAGEANHLYYIEADLSSDDESGWIHAYLVTARNEERARWAVELDGEARTGYCVVTHCLALGVLSQGVFKHLGQLA